MPGASSRGIFLSYRREDAAPHARLLQIQLRERFPDSRVFMDLDSIETGLDFAEVIEQAVDSCAVLVALIGPQWATLTDKEGDRRLDNPEDFVRFEVQAALERGVRVIPVLVNGAKPLRWQELPAGLQRLARLNALELSYGRYQYDADRLLDLIRRVLAAVQTRAEAGLSEPRGAEQQGQLETERQAREAEPSARKEAERPAFTFGGKGLMYDIVEPSSSRPASYDDLVRRALAELVQPGRLLFNPPNQMQLGQTERVEVRLTRTPLALDVELLKHLRGHGVPQLEEIPTAPLMAVTLKGDGFRITVYSDEEQGVTQDGITTWEFDIHAIKRGQQRLILSVSLRIPVPGQPSEHKSVPVREATIDVTVGAPALIGHFVTSNWQWFIGTAVAIAAVVVAVLYH
jgi:hypothetical protein